MKVQLSEKVGLPTDLILVEDKECFLLSTSNGYILRYTCKDFTLVATTKVSNTSIRRIFIVKDACFVALAEGGLLYWRFMVENSKGTALNFAFPNGDNDENEVGVINTFGYHSGPDHLYLGTEDGDLLCCQLDVVDGSAVNVVKKYDHHDDFISSIHISATKKIALVGSGDGTMSVIDLKKKVLVASTKNFEADVTTIEYLEGGSNKVILGTSMGALKAFSWNYWGAPSDSLKAKFHNHSSINRIVSLKDDGDGVSSFVTASDDGCLRLCSIQPLGEQLTTIFHVEDDSLEGVIFLPPSTTADAVGKHNFVCIPAAEAVFYVVSVAKPSRQDSKNVKDQECEDSIDSDKDEMDFNSKKKTKRRKKTLTASDDSFFKDLD